MKIMPSLLILGTCDICQLPIIEIKDIAAMDGMIVHTVHLGGIMPNPVDLEEPRTILTELDDIVLLRRLQRTLEINLVSAKVANGRMGWRVDCIINRCTTHGRASLSMNKAINTMAAHIFTKHSDQLEDL